MILCGDETTICSMVNAWDVMASISISAGENMDKMKSSMSWPEKFKSVPLTLLTPYFVSSCVIKKAGAILSLQAVFLRYCGHPEREIIGTSQLQIMQAGAVRMARSWHEKN